MSVCSTRTFLVFNSSTVCALLTLQLQLHLHFLLHLQLYSTFHLFSCIWRVYARVYSSFILFPIDSLWSPPSRTSQSCRASLQISHLKSVVADRSLPEIPPRRGIPSQKEYLEPRPCFKMRICPPVFDMAQARHFMSGRGAAKRPPQQEKSKQSRPTMRKRFPVVARIIRPKNASSRILW